jgi:DNA-binding response OmpR family regulator
MDRTVLIIDDEVDLCLMIREYLNKKGYTVYVAHTLADGRKKLALFKPDILLLDNQLPDGLGWTEVQGLHDEYPGMKMTLISAYGTPKELLFPPGIPVTILDKPLSMSDIVESFAEGDQAR